MTDLELTKLCAEAMGFGDKVGTTFECGIDEEENDTGSKLFMRVGEIQSVLKYGACYDPLHDDAQAMALIRKLGLGVWLGPSGAWYAEDRHGDRTQSKRQRSYVHAESDKTINRAIVECVAKMQKAKV